MIERTATREQWSEIVARVREKNPRVADALEAGASITVDGVRIHPPLLTVAKEIPLFRTTLTAAPRAREN